jgi:hypothetical protein
MNPLVPLLADLGSYEDIKRTTKNWSMILNSEWDTSNENLVSVEAWVGMPGPSATFDFLGLHPYKQIALFGAYGSIMAYHLSSSKVRDLGFIPMGTGIQVSFPYTPCWMGPLPETQFR